MKSQEWTGKPDEELPLPEEYEGIYEHDITILSAKKQMQFYCGKYALEGPFATFYDVLMDNSDKNTRGKIIVKRVAYYDKVVLANTGFVVRPILIPEPSSSQTPSG